MHRGWGCEGGYTSRGVGPVQTQAHGGSHVMTLRWELRSCKPRGAKDGGAGLALPGPSGLPASRAKRTHLFKAPL